MLQLRADWAARATARASRASPHRTSPDAVTPAAAGRAKTGAEVRTRAGGRGEKRGEGGKAPACAAALQARRTHLRCAAARARPRARAAIFCAAALARGPAGARERAKHLERAARAPAVPPRAHPERHASSGVRSARLFPLGCAIPHGSIAARVGGSRIAAFFGTLMCRGWPALTCCAHHPLHTRARTHGRDY